MSIVKFEEFHNDYEELQNIRKQCVANTGKSNKF